MHYPEKFRVARSMMRRKKSYILYLDKLRLERGFVSSYGMKGSVYKSLFTLHWFYFIFFSLKVSPWLAGYNYKWWFVFQLNTRRDLFNRLPAQLVHRFPLSCTAHVCVCFTSSFEIQIVASKKYLRCALKQTKKQSFFLNSRGDGREEGDAGCVFVFFFREKFTLIRVIQIA